MRARFVAIVMLVAACGDDAVHHLADAPAIVDARADAPARDAPIDAPITCTADTQCASGACHEETGTCVDESAALYVVATGGDDTGTCTRGAPCATIAYAGSIATATRAFVALAPGTYAAFDRGAATVPIVVSGPARSPAVATTIDVGANTSFAAAGDEYEGLEMTTATTNVFVLESNAGTATLERVVVHDIGYICLYTRTNAGLHLEDTALVNCANLAIEMQGGTLVADRLAITGAGTGILASGTTSITNSIIEGQLAIDAELTATPIAIDFSTLVGTSESIVSAVSTLTVTDSILVGAISGSTATSYSLFTSTPPAGTGNLMATPLFADAANHDYHLADNSPGIDAADPAATLDHDLDGDVRPRGAGRDMGADEHQ